ncbi:YozQ family protein [Peribacillus glennii]|uniref:DUF4025 domain-containing protein n=1 Tax=Peribacillus glennii TaxID=2303991 RepID=A0A372LH78_9BACI|nr:YozQ family protein [Peribacillus glennii]RFU65344.1 DUF4025 domain-containing protein [Peribacillus glennii]
MENNKKKQPFDSSGIAGRTFDFDDYNKDDEVSSGLAETHEQMSDHYAGRGDTVENRDSEV